jgi:nitroimidazol reductase NimA-like FMN-containing flavoprotein (pyridoxamine 5'-phosphate oxidase superfamily)
VSQEELIGVARSIVDANRYMTLATADESGLPWASPVWFAHAGYAEYYWVSTPDARHSQNLRARADLGVVIFDSGAAVGTGQAVYMEATARELATATSCFVLDPQVHGHDERTSVTL